MAIISCPACSKKISDKAQVCNHCDFTIQALDKDKLAAIEAERRIKQQQSLMNQSFIAMLLFCGGFLFLFWHNAQPGTWQYIGSVACTVIGFCMYLITRARLIFLKRKK